MLGFFEKNWQFLIFATMLASFVIYSVRKEHKEEEKKQGKNIQKKTEENKKDKD